MKAPLVSLASALLLAGGLAACSSKVPGEVAAIAERACACQTAECADKVEKESQEYFARNAKVKGTKEERDETQEHYNRMRECIGRARGAAAPASGQEAAGEAPATPAGEAPTGEAPAGEAPATPAGKAPATPAPAAPAESK